MSAQERIAAVVETLRFCADGWVNDADIDGGDNQRWLRKTADEIETTDPAAWWCCPLCQEVECDDNCPLLPVRRDVPDVED